MARCPRRRTAPGNRPRLARAYSALRVLVGPLAGPAVASPPRGLYLRGRQHLAGGTPGHGSGALDRRQAEGLGVGRDAERANVIVIIDAGKQRLPLSSGVRRPIRRAHSLRSCITGPSACRVQAEWNFDPSRTSNAADILIAFDDRKSTR